LDFGELGRAVLGTWDFKSMHIREFRIYRYGPLTDSGRIALGDFNLFFGLNEEGKSLTIDGLVRLLFSKKATKNVFKRIDRVDNVPEGYIIVEDEGDMIKFPDAGDITEFADFSPREWRNIFIIRNSDLSISEEESFYTGVTDRLTGLKSKRIMSVKNRLRDIGKLTRPDSSGKLSDREADEKLLSRVNRAESLIEVIESLKVEAGGEGLDEIEARIEDMNEELERIGTELTNLEDAGRRERYERGLDALNGLKHSLRELKELEPFKEDVQRNFRDSERDIRLANEEIEKLTSEIKSKETDYQNIKKIKGKKTEDQRIISDRKKKVEYVELDIKRYKELRREVVQRQSETKGLRLLLVISLSLFALSLIGAIIRPGPIFRIFSTIFLVVSIYPLIERFRLLKKASCLARLFEEIRLILAPIGLSSGTLEGTLSLLQKFEEEVKSKEEELRRLEENTNILEREIETIKRKIGELERKRREFEKAVEEIKNVSRVKDLDEYRKNLDRRQEIERMSREYAAVLKSLLGTGDYSGKEELMQYWDETLSELEVYKNKAAGVKYSDAEKRELQEKREDIDRTRAEIEKKYINWQDSLKQIERDAQDILKSEVYCGTLKELSFVHKTFRHFVDGVEKNSKNVLSVIRIFEEIEKEEESKISKYFGKDSKVSKYFSNITDGLYTAVEIEAEDKRVLVHTRDDNILDALKLSGGAYDQLYLCIRLALGEELLNKGFFVMDDPFVKSDFKRLRSQMRVLQKIVGEGWQILYFTAKNEVKEALKGNIEAGEVNLIETNWITP